MYLEYTELLARQRYIIIQSIQKGTTPAYKNQMRRSYKRSMAEEWQRYLISRRRIPKPIFFAIYQEILHIYIVLKLLKMGAKQSSETDPTTVSRYYPDSDG